MGGITTVSQAVDFFFDVKGIKRTRGLDRMRSFMHLLGDPQERLRFVHVAGTNGKGSTCACIESIMRHAGYKTGMFISPHLKDFNERISVNGENIPDADLIELANILEPVANSMEEYPTVFELIAAAGFLYFDRCRCDIVVLEVGVGGIFDPTNIIPVPEVAVITPIGLDHCSVLGNTLPEVASNKAGIIKAGGRAAVYPGDADVNAVFSEQCRKVGAELRSPDFDAINVLSSGLDELIFDFGSYKNIHLPLVGTYQPRNAALALTAVDFLRLQGWHIGEGAVLAGLANVKWPGRFEVLCKKPVFVLDGSHNPHGFAATAASLAHYFPERKFIFIMGIMEDKDYSGVLEIALPIAESIIAVAPDDGRALSSVRLSEIVRANSVDAVSCDSVEEAVHLAFKTAGNEGVICAFGSLYLSSEIKEQVLGYTADDPQC